MHAPDESSYFNQYSPYTWCELYSKGKITEDELVRILTDYEYEPSLVDTPNSFDSVERALENHLISEDLYYDILYQVPEEERKSRDDTNSLTEKLRQQSLSRRVERHILHTLSRIFRRGKS